MQVFRRLMAVPMGLTAAALGWLALRLGGPLFAGAALALAMVMIVVLAWAGRAQRRGHSALKLTAAGIFAIALVAAFILPGAVRKPDAAAAGILAAKPFSAAALAEARRSGRPVFAWFTADWCLTRKVNEQVAIERPATRDAFAAAKVVTLRGDWTRRDPEITRFLTEQGAAGVPLYVWYPADGGAPQVLPQLLGPDTLPEKASGK
jgi:thiol:disulfide interchange protein